MKKNLIVFSIVILLSGCNTSSPIEDLFEGRKIDYRHSKSQKQIALKYPPNVLGTPDNSNADSISVKEYSLDNIPLPEEKIAVQSLPIGVRYMKNGDLRWIEVDAPIEKVWDRVLQFWENDLGFPLTKQSKRNGIIETDFLDIRDNIPVPGDDFFTPLVSRFLDRTGDSGERDKFITRLEPLGDNKTEVYVAHQHIAASFTDVGLFSSYQRLPEDDDVEIEMLRRLMFSFSKSELDNSSSNSTNQEIANQESQAVISDYVIEGDQLRINRPFKEAWNIVQVGLNRGGFSIEDRIIGDKVIFIKYGIGEITGRSLGVEIEKKNFFQKIFGDDEPILYELTLQFTVVDNQSVTIEIASTDEEFKLNAQQKELILKLIYDYLPQ